MSFEGFIKELNSDKTARAYREDLSDFQAWFEDSNGQALSPSLVTSLDLKEYQSHLIHNRKLKPATVNRRISAVKSWLRWCQEKGEIDSLPRWPRRVQEVKHAPKALTKQEQDKFLRVVEREGNERDKAIIGLMIFGGLRVAEITKIRVQDIEISERKGKVRIYGKGNKFREMPLGLDAREMLKPWLARMQGKEYLFPGPDGNPISVRTVQQIVKKYAWKAYIDPTRITPHVLRHTFATRLLREGKDIVIVASLLGHARLETTARYTLPSYSEREKALE